MDDEFCCGVAYEVVLTEGLRVGAELDEAALDRLRSADERWRAKESALSLLAVRPRARRELAGRLERKGYAEPAVAWALAEADRLGLLDDTAFAEAWVRDRLRLRPRGARALQSELVRKGVAPDVASDAVTRVMADAGARDGALCMAAAEKWMRSNGRRLQHATDVEERRRVERRLSGFLMRRGFAPADIRDAIRTCVRSQP
ncbi:MAG TPA: regulatory protein RecX [Longimicrobiales bacterium]|nr:regulatory protein RecX [Longimicrobiales bacterium]